MVGCAKEDTGRPRVTANDKATTGLASTSVFDLDGQPFDLGRQEQGAVTVVVFTRTDCPISNRCAPEVRRLYERYQPQGVQFFLIYVDPREQPDAIRRHLKEFAYPCIGLRDPHHALVAHCQATTTPEAAVFDKTGAITYLGRVDDLYLDVGRPRAAATTHDLADAIESTVQGRPVTTPRTKAIGCWIADLKN
jgi:hypothetical protein